MVEGLRNSIVSWIMKKRFHQIELFMKYPHNVQFDWFTYLLETAKDTEWGKRYKFEEINSYEQFKSRVPIQDYDSLKADIDRTMKGEQNILWPTEIKWFAKSSGTTSDKSKFIPVSKESLEDCHYKAGKDLISIYYNYEPESKLFTGRGLVLGGSSEVNQFGEDSYFGDLSAVIIKNLPFWAEYQRTPSMDIALMPEWEEKLEKMASITADQDITSITGVPSWTMVLLRRVMQLKKAQYITDVWPNLELYAHGGVSFDPYRKQYEEIMGKPITYLENYNASEGFIGIQDLFGEDENGLLLMLDYGIFYEFMPLEELGKEFPKTLQLDEVELGVNYAVVISTNGGLWRYMIGDTVAFSSLAPYRIRVTGRTKHYINVFGEELIIDNAEKALQIACEKTNAIVADYTAAPRYMEGKEKGAHEWLIEFDRDPNDLSFFEETLDNALKSINSDYEAKRYKGFVLEPLSVKKLEKDTFYRWMKSRGKLGGQNKVPRLSNNREYVDSILKFVE